MLRPSIHRLHSSVPSLPPLAGPGTQACRANRPICHKRRLTSSSHLSHRVLPLADSAQESGTNALPSGRALAMLQCLNPISQRNVRHCMVTISLRIPRLLFLFHHHHLSPKSRKRYSNPCPTRCRPSRPNPQHWPSHLPPEFRSILHRYHYPWSVHLPSPLSPSSRRPYLSRMRRRLNWRAHFPRHWMLEHVSTS